MTRPRAIALLVFDRLQHLDLAGPMEVLDTADQVAGGGAYALHVVSPDDRPVRTSSGLAITPTTARADLPRRLDTFLVVGGRGTREHLDDERFLATVRDLAARADRVASVCTGALVLAAAGLLDGHRATTHWAWSDHLAALGPSVEVEPDAIYVRDGDRWTSAGVTAGIDLTLAMVEVDLGAPVAHEVAGHLVVFARRPGGQAQFSAALVGQTATSPALADLQAWLPDHLDEDCTVEALARRTAMSPRTFARTFRAEVGTTPAAHVEALRIEAARRLLATTDLGVAAVATRVGFGRPETLHRAFARRVGTTPARYRQHFSHHP
ncbi:MAG: helix-turn-helix domain-containing protein [Acidimicrobiales bacterium]|nr:helix-turn-helix domain-containing protein [Acidimicrobiales bacterium]